MGHRNTDTNQLRNNRNNEEVASGDDLTQRLPAVADLTESERDGNAVAVAGGDEDDAMDDGTKEFGRLMKERRVTKKKRLIRRIVIAVVVVALIIGLMVWRAMSSSVAGGDVSVSTATVERGRFVDKVSSTGSVEPISSTVVAPQIDGTIGEVKVQEARPSTRATCCSPSTTTNSTAT